MSSIEAALQAWREAERRIEEADGNVTPEMEHQLAEARSRYRELAEREETQESQSDAFRSYAA
jgi:hypothetical protein